VVPKRNLGRGLGDLLSGQRHTLQPGGSGENVDSGLRILIEGTPRRDASPTTSVLRAAKEPREAAAERLRAADSVAARAVAIVALISADVVLLCWTARFTYSHQHALAMVPAAGCAFSILVAALCGCTAVVMLSSQR